MACSWKLSLHLLTQADLCALQICEDSPAQLKSDVPGVPDGATSLLIPRILHLFKSPFAEARGLAVTVMNLLAAALPEALTGHEQM